MYESPKLNQNLPVAVPLTLGADEVLEDVRDVLELVLVLILLELLDVLLVLLLELLDALLVLLAVVDDWRHCEYQGFE